MTDDRASGVLGIVGSPRKGGNTDLLVDEVLAGARDIGMDTKKFNLGDLTIHPCKACNACSKTGECIQQDDMFELIAHMQSHEIWVLGTPVYWSGPTAQFKAFIDRWFAPERSLFRGRKVILIVVSGGRGEPFVRHTIGMMEEVFPYLRMDHISTITATGFSRRGTVREDSDLMNQARTVITRMSA